MLVLSFLLLILSMISSPVYGVPTLFPATDEQIDNVPTISNTSITKSFSFPVLLFEGEVVSEIKQTITWNTDGSTVVSDDKGNNYTLRIPVNQGQITLLQSGETITHRVVNHELQYDVNWESLKNTNGIVDKYKFSILGNSKKPSTIVLDVASSQNLEAKNNRFTVVKNNVYDSILQSNSTISGSQIMEEQKEGIGLDWSELFLQDIMLVLIQNQMQLKSK